MTVLHGPGNPTMFLRKIPYEPGANERKQQCSCEGAQIEKGHRNPPLPEARDTVKCVIFTAFLRPSRRSRGEFHFSKSWNW